MHKMSAGSGYRYLLDSVAVGGTNPHSHHLAGLKQPLSIGYAIGG